MRTPVEGLDRGRVPDTRDDDLPEAGGCPPSTGTLATGSSTGTPVMVPPFHARLELCRMLGKGPDQECALSVCHVRVAVDLTRMCPGSD